MTHEQLKAWAREEVEYKYTPGIYPLAQGYLALSVQLEEAQAREVAMAAQTVKTVDFHRDMAARFAEDRDQQKHALRTALAQLKEAQEREHRYENAQCIKCAADLDASHGEVVTACPRCGSQKDQKDRGVSDPPFSGLSGYGRWFCHACFSEYQEPAYYQKVNAPVTP